MTHFPLNGEPASFAYDNHEGKLEWRSVNLVSMWWGICSWHADAGAKWYLTARDPSRSNEERHFALDKIKIGWVEDDVLRERDQDQTKRSGAAFLTSLLDDLVKARIDQSHLQEEGIDSPQFVKDKISSIKSSIQKTLQDFLAKESGS